MSQGRICPGDGTPVIIIIIIIIAFKGTIRDFWQAPHSAASRLRHVRSSGPGTIVYTSSAYHVQHVVLRATWYEGTAQLLSLTEYKSHLFELYFIGWDINRWRRGVPGGNPWRRASENATYYSPNIQAPSETRTRTIALVAGYESRSANRYTTRRPRTTQRRKMQIHLGLLLSHYSILFYSRLCPSTAGSSPPPESSIFLCPLLSLSIPLPVAPQRHLSNDVLVFRLILHPLSATLCF